MKILKIIGDWTDKYLLNDEPLDWEGTYNLETQNGEIFHNVKLKKQEHNQMGGMWGKEDYTITYAFFITETGLEIRLKDGLKMKKISTDAIPAGSPAPPMPGMVWEHEVYDEKDTYMNGGFRIKRDT